METASPGGRGDLPSDPPEGRGRSPASGKAAGPESHFISGNLGLEQCLLRAPVDGSGNPWEHSEDHDKQLDVQLDVVRAVAGVHRAALWAFCVGAFEPRIFDGMGCYEGREPM